LTNAALVMLWCFFAISFGLSGDYAPAPRQPKLGTNPAIAEPSRWFLILTLVDLGYYAVAPT
jgi:hypothetical protein